MSTLPGRGLVEPGRGRVQRGVDPDQRRQRRPTRSAARRRRSRPRSPRRRRAPARPRRGSGRSPRPGPAGPCRSRRSRTGCRPGRRRRPGSGRGPGGGRGPAPRSPTRKRAWACGERTARRCQAPSAGRSSPNSSAPVTLASPSVRAMRAPTAAPTAGTGAGDRAARRGRANGIDDRGVPGAPAEHAAQAVEHLGRRRARVSRDEVAGRHQHPRRAGAALRAAAGEERGLERRRAAGPGETLDRLDAPALDLARGDEAGADLLPVEPHGARAAVAGVAADLGAGQAEVLAQDVHEAAPPVRPHLDASPVDLGTGGPCR